VEETAIKPSDTNPADEMILSCMKLAMKLIYHEGDFYPLLYYFDKDDQVVSSTIGDKIRFDELDQLVKHLAKTEGFEDYTYAFNDPDMNRIILSVYMRGIQYPYQVLDYKFNETGIKFSELYSEKPK
jgi:hypothetical protein